MVRLALLIVDGMDITLAIPECRFARFVEHHEDHLIIPVQLDAASDRCPECGHASRSVHSRYQRHPADLPLSASRTTLRIEVRRFYCRIPACRRRTFADVNGLRTFRNFGPAIFLRSAGSAVRRCRGEHLHS
ncbi:hypothetical protein DK412_14825 [Methylobacterium sp. 17Sr1-1]|nr:hypothetical protein DK412_14825 [Methylobacterium sp. 17Sr1-1]